jgi:hypothetical protein
MQWRDIAAVDFDKTNNSSATGRASRELQATRIVFSLTFVHPAVQCVAANQVVMRAPLHNHPIA